MQSLKTGLKTSLKNELKAAKRVAVLGIGSQLRSDDVAGILVVEYLSKITQKKSAKQKLGVFFGGTAPENLTGEIKRFKPSHIIIVDCAEIQKKPGEVLLFHAQDSVGISFSTHRLPMKIMAQYLESSLKSKIIIIGIQPKTLSFSESCSPQVKKAAKNIAEIIADTVK